MTHKIPYEFASGLPLNIPHCFGFPPYTDDDIYDLIVPEDFSLSEGDGVHAIKQDGKTVDQTTVLKIIERRPAKGDWSKQEVHKSPDFIRFISVPKPIPKKK